MALRTKSTTTGIKDELFAQMQVQVEKVRQKLVREFEDKFSAALQQIALKCTIDVEHYYSLQDQEDHVTVTFKMPNESTARRPAR